MPLTENLPAIIMEWSLVTAPTLLCQYTVMVIFIYDKDIKDIVSMAAGLFSSFILGKRNNEANIIRHTIDSK